MNDRPVRVALIEDNAVFREALELLLELRPEIEVVGTHADGREVVALCAQTRPDVVLVDYRLPGLDGVQVTAAVRDAFTDVAVLCLTASVTAREVEALEQAGAVGCVMKGASLDEIVAAIVRAAGRAPADGR
jgi:DNA-binding NarL/FixJ family response regulator